MNIIPFFLTLVGCYILDQYVHEFVDWKAYQDCVQHLEFIRDSTITTAVDGCEKRYGYSLADIADPDTVYSMAGRYKWPIQFHGQYREQCPVLPPWSANYFKALFCFGDLKKLSIELMDEFTQTCAHVYSYPKPPFHDPWKSLHKALIGNTYRESKDLLAKAWIELQWFYNSAKTTVDYLYSFVRPK